MSQTMNTARTKSQINRRHVLAGAATLPLIAGCKNHPPRKPNVILILTDDLRADAVNSELAFTPNINALVKDGHSYRDAFVTTSICPTSRASIMTGKYASRHKLWGFGAPAQAALDNGLYGTMRKADYATAYIGKWGMGYERPSGLFDIWNGFGNEKQYFDEAHAGQHLTSYIGDEAIKAIAALAPSPFFLTFSTKAPHAQDGNEWPFQADPQFGSMYSNLKYPLAVSATQEQFDLLPDFLKTSEGRIRWQQRFGTPDLADKSLRDYYRLVTGIDLQVGRIVDELKSKKLYDDTLIIFTSDNGMMLGEHGLSGKWWMFEESIRIPLIIKPPKGKSIPSKAQQALNIDVMPTILDGCGIELATDIQGKSLLTKSNPRKSFFYEHQFEHPTIAKSEGLRTERYKYIKFNDASGFKMLFDLQADPFELNNLASRASHKGILEQMQRDFDIARSAVVQF